MDSNSYSTAEPSAIDIPARKWSMEWILAKVSLGAALYPKRTLVLALAITILAIATTISRLEFRTSRLDLLSKSAHYNVRWLDYLKRFGQDDDAVVVVSHTDPIEVANTLQAIGQRLTGDSRLQGVMYRRSSGNAAHKALQLLPDSELAQLDQLIQLSSASLQAASLGGSMPNNLASSASSATMNGLPSSSPARGLPGIDQLSAALTEAQLGLDRVRQAIPEEGPMLVEDNGTLGMCLVRLPHADNKPKEVQALIQCLHDHINAVREQHAKADIWLTGMPVLEWDESQSSQRDMQNATLLSLVGVALIIVFGFGSWRMPLAAVACLAISLIWTVALAALFVGHLNLFSVAFGAIIAGLGIDYAIHLLTRLQVSHKNYTAQQLPQAFASSVAHCGKGILTGAVTTAVAFAVAMLTPFQGMAELGLICALGTMTCMSVTFWVLPALIVVHANWRGNSHATNDPSWLDKKLIDFYSGFENVLQNWNHATLKYRLLVLVCGLLATASCAVVGRTLHYDHNLLNLQADDVPSVHAEREITRRGGQSAWFAVSLARSPQAAMALREKLLQLPSVARVEDIGSVIARSNSSSQHQQLLLQCRAHAQQLLERIEMLTTSGLAHWSSADSHVALASASSTRGPDVHPASSTTTSGFDSQITAQMRLLATSIDDMSLTEPMSLADYPTAVRTRMASDDGQTFLLRIFAKNNLWQRENLGQFVKELESVDPRVTGHPIQTWYASGELEASYYQAGIYAFLVVTALLMMDLGSIRLVALALLPVTFSLLQLCGILVALRIPFNAANMIVLPLILGIGIDDGVHILHDFRNRGTTTFRLSTSTTLAILLTSLTTIVGFGCMAIADHRGLQSLGIVLGLGVGLCLINSWFVLPSLLSYLGAGEVDNETHQATDMPEQVAIDDLESKNQTPVANADRQKAPHDDFLLLQDIPIVLSLPDYPDA